LESVLGEQGKYISFQVLPKYLMLSHI